MRFLRDHWYDLGLCIVVVIALALWFGDFSYLACLLWLSFASLCLHQFEEYRYPGYFPGMVNKVLYASRQPDRFPLNSNTSLIVNVAIGWSIYCLAALVAEHALWLAIASILVSLANIIAHCLLFNLRARTLYNPGMLTSLLLFLPIMLLFFWHVLQAGLATWSDWLIGIVLGIILNYVGILKLIDWLKDEKTSYIFAPRQMIPYK
mgnify:CR=1 FL=1|jgi:hypothetical protein